MTRLLLCGAAAGAMGWGIRGQYGHETGAMIAGLLVSLVIVLLLQPTAPPTWALRAVAFGTIGAGFGGAMTYGQTIGLTQDAALVGNTAALRWGLLGLAVKGGIWIGLLGAWLGMGLGAVRYRSREVLLLMLGLVAASLLGAWLLNEPHHPEARVLPRVYFSASWYWQPDAVQLTPRREVWGGLLVALAALLTYAGVIRKDVLTRRLAAWGVAGGAIGFPLGQGLQAWHAWHLEAFTHGWWARVDPFVNWWNLMETTFGAVMGAGLAAGAWRNRHLIVPGGPARGEDRLPPAVEWVGLSSHAALLLVAEFTEVPLLSRYADVPLVIGVLPLALAAGGTWSPALVALPITLLPIAGKTVRRLVYEQRAVEPVVGWVCYALLPLLLAVVVAWWSTRRAHEEARRVLGVALLVATWTLFGLNFAFFDYPWPWAVWTARTLHALSFFACALVVTLGARRAASALRVRRRP